MGRYFTVEKKLTIAASIQHAAFASGEIMVDWTAIQVPRGASCLRSATVLVRPKGDAGPTINVFAFDLVFSKTNTVSLGTPGGGISRRPSEDFIGQLEFDTASFNSTGFKSTAIATIGTDTGGGTTPLVLQGDPTTGDNVGYDVIYVGMIARGSFDFTSINTVNETGFGAEAQTVITMDDGSAGTTMNCLEHFTAGDILHAQDDAVLGTFSSGSAQEITLTAANTAAIAENDVIYNLHPIKLVLGFEK